ncbi:ACT domain-containing protein ACR8-like [Lolium perenne]|uniref:ACT domain-containing protein ACR8-like n=1 Tax=Lolium perenne TaxID=4522 RepID=UPI0021F5D161|nr:ACT domain-containing protein ACR8-like [Lolium perenne]
MQWVDENGKLIGMDTPKVVIDNAVCPTATLVQVHIATKRGVLLDALQLFADLDLSVKKAYISCDGWWFMYLFHVTDRFGRKLTDGVTAYIQQSVGAWTEPSQPVALAGLTVLELTGVDRTGLISELFAVLADMGCSVVAASAWTHRGRLACLVYLRDVDAVRVARIESRLGALFRGVSDDASAGVVAVPAHSVPHPDRRLHQLMCAARDPDRAFPTSSVSVESCGERGYSVVTVQCPDRPKLLYDVVCTLADMDYLVVDGTVDTSRGEARQEFYIRNADGSPTSSEAEMQRVSQRLQDAIERRSFEGVRLELRTPDRPELLSDVTRTFRENGLLVTQAEVSTKGDMATGVFYVTGTTAGQPVHQSAIDAVRERVGIDCLVVEEHRPQLYEDDHNGAGTGLLYSLGNLVKMKFYNLGLIWMYIPRFRNKRPRFI